MVAGHLSEKSGRWYFVIELRDINGIRKPKWISTGLPVKGNKRRAEELLYQKRVEYSAIQHCQKNSGEMFLLTIFPAGW